MPGDSVGSPTGDAAFYEAAYLELQSDRKDLGLWAKALAQADGDLEKARARYVQWRVNKMRAAAAPAAVTPPETVTPSPPPAEAATAAGSAPAAPGPSPERASNYLLRHWRGQLSLPVSYWVNGSLVGALFGGLGAGLGTYLPKAGYSLKTAVSFNLLLLIFIVVYWIWSSVGIWRSADRRISEGKRKGWANAAKVAVSLGALMMVSKLITSIVPNVVDEVKVLTDNDPYGRMDVKISSDGRALIFNGGMGAGATEKVKALLDAAPAVRTLQLNSIGGRLVEANQLAKLVRARQLDTYVEGECVSACTYVFLAGNDRAATPTAKIGFHKPSTAGAREPEEERASIDEMSRVYREDGIPEEFIQKVVSTEAVGMWYPSREELIRANVITRVSLGDEVNPAEVLRSKDELYLAFKGIPLYTALEKRFPGSMDEIVNKVWESNQAGASVGEMMTAGRGVIAAKFPILLKTASPALLQEFQNLLTDELDAARAVSPQACMDLMATKLDIAMVFPKELTARDVSLTYKLVTSPPVTPHRIRGDQLSELLTPVRVQMTSRELAIVTGNPPKDADAGEQCDALRHMYHAMNRLPETTKLTVLEGIYQSQ
jgi:hypothetical protein